MNILITEKVMKQELINNNAITIKKPIHGPQYRIDKKLIENTFVLIMYENSTVTSIVNN